MAKETIIKMKREPNVWEDIFVNNILDKGLFSKILYIKNLYDLTAGR